MSTPNRRQALKTFLEGVLQVAGTVVLASSALSARADEGKTDAAPEETADLEQRANQIADAQGAMSEGGELCSFANGAFRNGGGGSFRNGGFVNGGGGFRNGGFANGGGGGGFRNGGFANSGGGFRNGGFVNGGGGSGFRNGTFANGGWRN